MEGERTPDSKLVPDSSARSGSAEDDARTSPPEPSSSRTPGASGSVSLDSQASVTSPLRTARANKGEASASSSTSLSWNSGSPARRMMITAPQVEPSATNALRSSGPYPPGFKRSRSEEHTSEL